MSFKQKDYYLIISHIFIITVLFNNCFIESKKTLSNLVLPYQDNNAQKISEDTLRRKILKKYYAIKDKMFENASNIKLENVKISKNSNLNHIELEVGFDITGDMTDFGMERKMIQKKSRLLLFPYNMFLLSCYLNQEKIKVQENKKIKEINSFLLKDKILRFKEYIYIYYKILTSNMPEKIINPDITANVIKEWVNENYEIKDIFLHDKKAKYISEEIILLKNLKIYIPRIESFIINIEEGVKIIHPNYQIVSNIDHKNIYDELYTKYIKQVDGVDGNIKKFDLNKIKENFTLDSASSFSSSFLKRFYVYMINNIQENHPSYKIIEYYNELVDLYCEYQKDITRISKQYTKNTKTI